MKAKQSCAFHLAEELGDKKGTKKIRRVLFHEITKAAVQAAMANPMDINMNRVDAQQTRRILDRLVGYKISPLLWDKVRRRKGSSAGRVQTVALRLIVEREAEIRAFRKPPNIDPDRGGPRSGICRRPSPRASSRRPAKPWRFRMKRRRARSKPNCSDFAFRRLNRYHAREKTQPPPRPSSPPNCNRIPARHELRTSA